MTALKALGSFALENEMAIKWAMGSAMIGATSWRMEAVIPSTPEAPIRLRSSMALMTSVGEGGTRINLLPPTIDRGPRVKDEHGESIISEALSQLLNF